MKNKTVNNLQTIWQQLDDACGSLGNALINLGGLREVSIGIKIAAERIDFSSIVELKYKIEMLKEEIESRKEVE